MGSARLAALDLLDRTFRSKPLVFVTFAWMAGIGLADHLRLAPAMAVGMGLAVGMAALASQRRWRSLVLLFAGVAALGLAATRLALLMPRGDISEWNGRQVGVAGIVDAEPVTGCDYWRSMVSCLSVTYAGRVYPARGRLYVTTEQDLSRLQPGDAVLVYGVPERPSPARNPGGYSRECWLARRGAFAVVSARPGAVVRLGVTAPGWRRGAARLRQRIAAANRRVMTDPEAAALVNSMLFGDLDSGDTRSWGATEERFRRAGVAHVLVVSGAQAALLFGMLSAWRRWALSRRRHDRRHWRLLRAMGGYSYRHALGGGLVLLALYVPLVGLQPSILRPTLVVTIFFLGRMLDREVDPENSLAAAALILLVVNPLTLYDLSFQLSFAAVWGIIRLTAPLISLLTAGKRPGEDEHRDEPVTGQPQAGRASFVVKILAITLAAQLATLPLTARQFQTLSLVAPLSNLPIIAMMTLLLPLGLASSMLNAVAAPTHGATWALLGWANWPTEQLARLIDWSVTALAHPAWATLPVSPPSWAEVALIALLLLVASLPSVVRRRALSLAIVALAIAVLAIAVVRPAPAVHTPTVTFIDVGQGDGCVIRLPGGCNLLVDGGGSPRAPCEQRDCSDAPIGHLAEAIRKDCTDIGRDILASYLRHERVRRIDLMVLTHPHDDHLWGLDALLDPRQGFDIGKVLDAGQPFASPANREWWALLGRRGLTPIAARRGMELTVGPARLVVLHPSGAFLGQTHKDPYNNSVVNNNSIVLRLEVAGTRVLLTGDAEAEAEAVMAGADLQADVLKVGHHGSAYSTSDAWIEQVHPRIAVISCGRHNAFGHPSPATLERLLRHGVQVYRTDQDGAVTLELKPGGWTATTMIQSNPAR
jgi:competence protein ComEC